MSDPRRYESPLASRNASAEMVELWSPQRKFSTWRRLWLALAEAQRELGLSITAQQISELAAHIDDIDLSKAAAYEKRLRHDVMAHIRALGDVAPAARPIIHLGATSQYLNCNTDLLLIREALGLVAQKVAVAIDQLGQFAERYRALPTLGLTHYQPAQPTTVGKRAAIWAHDLALALEEVELRHAKLRFRGVKGATGTQASFLALFNGDHDKVEALDRRVTETMGFDSEMRFVVTGQTYPRLVDAQVGASLSGVAAAAQKLATDLRLLAHHQELEEPFESEQVGSSSMAYKRNPMRCERICGLARFVIGLTSVPFTTAAEQWFERTLDDSSTRRLTLPEPFLAVDGLLETLIDVVSGIVVYEKRIEANLAAHLPLLASENVLMAAVKAGFDRQAVHETIRKHSLAAIRRVKVDGAANDLLDRLRGEPAFAQVDLDAILESSQFIGRAPKQVDEFIEQVVKPIRRRYSQHLNYRPQLKV